MSDLRPCPFCGESRFGFVQGSAVGNDGEDIGAPVDYAVYCDVCQTTGPRGTSEATTKAAWNKRTPDYEVKWAELVETIATRTDQRKVTP